MSKIIITEKGKSNLPVVIINTETDLKVVFNWAEKLSENPGMYDIELVSKFTFGYRCAQNLLPLMDVMVKNYEKFHGELTDDHVVIALCGVLQSFSFAEEKDKEDETLIF